MDCKWKVGLIGALFLGLSATGCVDEDASVVMKGNVISDGVLELADDEGGQSEARCEHAAEFDDIRIRSRGFIDLNHLREVGQPTVRGSGGFSATPNLYVYRTVFENRLFDSRTVGGGGSGGEGGGFENLELDRNDIIITRATVEFPAELNTFPTEGGNVTMGDIERERFSSMLVTAGGGIATLGVPLIDGAEERQMFEEFLGSADGGLGGEVAGPVTFRAEIQLHGETIAGNKVSSNTFQYPVAICANCQGTTDYLCASE